MMKKIKLAPVVLGATMLASCLAVAGCKGGSKSGNGASKVVEIGCEAKGYGSAFAYALAEEYNKIQSDVEVRVVKDTPMAGYHTNQLGLGGKKCDVDLFFTLTQSVFYTQSQAGKNHWADISEVYNTVAEGYAESDGTKTIKDLIEPSYVEQFTFTDGKQYSIPYTSGVVGLLYNKTKWDATNAKLKTAGEAELVLPKTTDEMFTLFNRMKTTTVKNASDGAYAFSYSGVDSYMHFLFNSLWPQYLGEVGASNFLEGKDENGVYTADIYNTKAREYAFEVVGKMIMKENGYVSANDAAQQYNQEQEAFLRGSAFFSCNGDWLERETSKKIKPGEADVVMLRTPVMSKIVEHDTLKEYFTGTSSQKDQKLSGIIAFIDENYIEKDGAPSEADAATLEVSLDALKFIHHARLARHSLIDFVAVVPEFSNELEETKDFLKFMYSKAGQDIVLQNTYGCAAPMTIDYSQMDYWKTATYYSKTRLELLSKSVSYGNAFCYPMQYLSSIRLYPDGNKIATHFGGDTPGSAKDIMTDEYKNYRDTWADKMEAAGVSNG